MRHSSVGRLAIACRLAGARWRRRRKSSTAARLFNLIIPNAPGGSFDLYARLAANHLGRFIPGNPSIVAQNMPGAAGMQAANYLANVAPKDGTVLSVLVPNITLAQILGVSSIAYDTRRYNWIGRIIATTATLFTWHTSGTKTLADLKTRETLVASTGPAEPGRDQLDHAQRRGRHKFKLIRGYRGSGEAALAVERGEADGTLMPWEFLKSAHADWVRDNKIAIVTRYVRRPIRGAAGRALGLRSGGDDRAGERAAALPRRRRDGPSDRDAARTSRATGSRRCAYALMTMVKDPEFLADAPKRKLDLLPGRHDELEKTVAEAFAASPAEIEIARKYYKQ